MGWSFSIDRDNSQEEDKGENNQRKTEDEQVVIEERRSIIQNQIDVLKHQRNIASRTLRLHTTLLILVIVSTTNAVLFRREEIMNQVSSLRSSIQDDVILDFGVMAIVLLAVSGYLILIYIVDSIRQSLSVLHNTKGWNLDTIPDTENSYWSDNQEQIIKKNNEDIKQNEAELRNYSQLGKQIVVGVSLSIVIMFILFSAYHQGSLSEDAAIALAFATAFLGPFFIPRFLRKVQSYRS